MARGRYAHGTPRGSRPVPPAWPVRPAPPVPPVPPPAAWPPAAGYPENPYATPPGEHRSATPVVLAVVAFVVVSLAVAAWTIWAWAATEDGGRDDSRLPDHPVVVSAARAAYGRLAGLA